MRLATQKAAADIALLSDLPKHVFVLFFFKCSESKMSVDNPDVQSCLSFLSLTLMSLDVAVDWK